MVSLGHVLSLAGLAVRRRRLRPPGVAFGGRRSGRSTTEARCGFGALAWGFTKLMDRFSFYDS